MVRRSLHPLGGRPHPGFPARPTRYAFASWISWRVITGTVAGYILLLVYHATTRGLITYPKTLTTATIVGALFAGHNLASVFWGGPISGF